MAAIGKLITVNLRLDDSLLGFLVEPRNIDFTNKKGLTLQSFVVIEMHLDDNLTESIRRGSDLAVGNSLFYDNSSTPSRGSL